jgi:hypothetical protein
MGSGNGEPGTSPPLNTGAQGDSASPPRGRPRFHRSIWIATGLVVGLLAVLAALFATGAITFAPAQGPESCPCGAPPFAIGNPVAGICPNGDSFTGDGCAAGEYVYTVTIESSVIQFDEVLFHISSGSGENYVATGASGFSIVNPQGGVLAQFSVPTGLMSMSSGWTTYAVGFSPTSGLLITDSVLVDMGTSNSHGQGCTIFANGTGQFVGTTSPEELP